MKRSVVTAALLAGAVGCASSEKGEQSAAASAEPAAEDSPDPALTRDDSSGDLAANGSMHDSAKQSPAAPDDDARDNDAPDNDAPGARETTNAPSAHTDGEAPPSEAPPATASTSPAASQSATGEHGDAGTLPSPPEGPAVDAGPAPAPVRPSLVTSVHDAFWQVSEPAVVTAEPEIRIDRSWTYQEWDGFGGTFEERSWEVLTLLEPAERERALRLLFDAEDGANFIWGRLPIGASDYALERYSLDDTPDDYAMEHFSIERDREYIIPFLSAALAVNPDLRLWAVPWSPPAWMKDTQSMDRGHIIDDSQVLSAYALYFARYIESYAEEGFAVEAVTVQNDPAIEMDLPTCAWYPDVYMRFVADFLGPTLLDRGVPTELWFGALADLPQDQPLFDEFLISPAFSFVSALGLQWNADELADEFAPFSDLPIIQTQHQADNLPWLPDFEPERAPNNYQTALDSWQLLVDWIERGVNVYHAALMVLDTSGLGLNELQPWPKSALLVVDREARTLTVTPTYYVFRHLSYFVDPGAVRVHAESSELQVLAFQNPDGHVVAVVHNPDTAERTTRLGIDDTTLEFSVPARGWATLNW